MLNGLEKYDYTKEEHIKFTYTNYIKEFIIERIGVDNRISKYL